MSKYSELFAVETPQSQPVPRNVSTAPQAVNNAGGFTFSLHYMKRLERFLILGSEAPTYYATANKLTKDNAVGIIEAWEKDPVATAAMIASISKNGLAPKNSPAIFATALGMVHTNVKARQWAGAIVKDVCRTSTHLFEFVETCVSLKKGWGRIMKRAVADWYNTKSDDKLAYQLIKYRQRNSYTHERLIRLSHPKQDFPTPAKSAMYDWLRGREVKSDELPDQIWGHILAMSQKDESMWATIADMYNLPWEALPTQANARADVWQAMLPKMPLTAMMRNLGNMTRLGVFDNYKYDEAIGRLSNEDELKKARLHPFQLLQALKTYQSGKGFRGTNTWLPIARISTTLENAFYCSFKTIQPANKRILLALDVSGSMTSPMGGSNMSVREASSAMAMATMKTEESCAVVGFTSLHAHNMGHAISPLAIRRNMTLDQVTSYTKGLPFSGTDCSLPILWALEHNLEVDAFVIYTDNETWAGRIQPVEALRRYRTESGISDAKLIVVGMTSTGFTIADPNDPNMLDVVGFDSSAPAVIANFIKGSLTDQREQYQITSASDHSEEISDGQD